MRGGVPGPAAPSHPEPRACLHPRGRTLLGASGGPGRIRCPGWGPPNLLTPGWARGPRFGGVRVGLGKRVPWGPRTVGKEPKVFSPASAPPPHHSRPRSRLLWGSPQPLPEGGGVRPAPQGWRPGSRSSKDPRTPTRRLGV